MNNIWNIVCNIYCYLHNYINNIPRISLLFNKVKLPLLCKWEEVIHADQNFTLEERAIILHALDDLLFFCNGLIKLQIIFDLDSKNLSFIDYNNTFIRADSSLHSIENADKRAKNNIFGLCEYKHNNSIKTLYIVVERIKTYNEFKTVVLHELGHALYMGHTMKPSIMHAYNYDDIAYLTYADGLEFAKIWHINVQDLRYLKLYHNYLNA